jgi:hypothetical protein
MYTPNQQPLFRPALYVRTGIGGTIGLILMCLFLYGVNDPDPEWGKFWYVRPLIVITLAGMAGGSFFHLMDHVSYKGGWRKVLAYLSSALVFLVGLWLGAVLGLDGTLWD